MELSQYRFFQLCSFYHSFFVVSSTAKNVMKEEKKTIGRNKKRYGIQSMPLNRKENPLLVFVVFTAIYQWHFVAFVFEKNVRTLQTHARVCLENLKSLWMEKSMLRSDNSPPWNISTHVCVVHKILCRFRGARDHFGIMSFVFSLLAGIFRRLKFERVQTEILVRHYFSVHRDDEHFVKSVVRFSAFFKESLAVRRSSVCRLRLLKTKIIVRVAGEKTADCFDSFVKIFDQFIPTFVDALFLKMNYAAKLLNHVIIFPVFGSNFFLVCHLNSTEKTVFSWEEIFLPHVLQVPSERFAIFLGFIKFLNYYEKFNFSSKIHSPRFFRNEILSLVFKLSLMSCALWLNLK